jgi:predicted transcriptional regulator
MAVIELSPEVDRQIDEVAHETGKSRDQVVNSAVLSYLEDRQDAMRAAERYRKIKSRISLEEIGRKYGVAD